MGRQVKTAARGARFRDSRGEAPPPAHGEKRAGAAKTVGRKAFEPKVREAVVEAAERAMEEGGLDAVQARPLAQAAGISVGSIYNLFGDLDNLTRTVNGRTYDELHAIETAALARALSRGADQRGQMLALAEAYLEFVRRRQTRWQATLAFNRRQAEPPPAWYREKEAALLHIIEEVIAGFPGAADAEARRLHAHALWASVHGIVTIAVTDGFRRHPIGDVWKQIEIVVNGIAAALEDASAGAGAPPASASKAVSKRGA
jgi:AcrR family transcriptional regulator